MVSASFPAWVSALTFVNDGLCKLNREVNEQKKKKKLRAATQNKVLDQGDRDSGRNGDNYMKNENTPGHGNWPGLGTF